MLCLFPNTDLQDNTHKRTNKQKRKREELPYESSNLSIKANCNKAPADSMKKKREKKHNLHELPKMPFQISHEVDVEL